MVNNRGGGGPKEPLIITLYKIMLKLTRMINNDFPINFFETVFHLLLLCSDPASSAKVLFGNKNVK